MKTGHVPVLNINKENCQTESLVTQIKKSATTSKNGPDPYKK